MSVAEASFFPLPPDILLTALVLSKPQEWKKYALWCTIGTVLGGILGWAIGFYLWANVQDFFFHYIPGFTPALFEKVSGTFRENAFWIIVFKGLTPIPYKIVTIAAGACQVSLPILIVASLISRGIRFYGVAGVIAWKGEVAKIWMEKYLEWILLSVFVGLVIGIVVLKFLK
jgi:membrane protein YqaA with SNARE-associated domain